MTDRDLDELCINSIRFLAVDAVQKAQSGHPGTPLGAKLLAAIRNQFGDHSVRKA